MKKKVLFVLFVVSLILLSGCGTDDYKPISEQQKKQTEKQKKETIKTLSGEEVINNLNLISDSEDSNFILNSLKDTYYYLNQDSYELVKYIENVQSGSMTKEKICNIIKEKSRYENEIFARLTPIKQNIRLYDKLNELRSLISKSESKGTGLALQYCEGDSALSLTNLNKARTEFLMQDSYFVDRKREPKEEYDPVWDITTYSSTTDQTIYLLIQEIESKLESPQIGGEYSIDDTMTKGGRIITLNKVEKGYLDPEFSFEKDCGTWTEEEKSEISEYKEEISKGSNYAIRDQLIEEYLGKYANKINNDCCKFWLFEFDGGPITAEKKKKPTPVFSIYDTEKENIIVYNPDVLIARYGSVDFRSNMKIFGHAKFDYKENIISYYLFGRDCEWALADMTKIKIVLSWDAISDNKKWDDCASTKKDILDTEKGLICDETFVFNVDLSKI